jgi:FlaA1/EpsC-like NDP-sugar epimerase
MHGKHGIHRGFGQIVRLNPRPPGRLSRVRFSPMALADAAAWVFGVVAAVLLRYDVELADVDLRRVALVAAVAVGVHLSAGPWAGLYVRRHRPGSFDEMSALAATLSLAAVAIVFLDLPLPRLVPLGSVVGASSIAFVLTVGIRSLRRVWVDRRLRPCGEDLVRAVVVGAGEDLAQIVHAMMRQPSSQYLPVALLDEDPRGGPFVVSGVPVFGARARLADAVTSTAADTVIVAGLHRDPAFLREVIREAGELGVDVKVLPPISELLRGGLDELQPVAPEDLLGRSEAAIDVEAVSGYVTGKRVLVTGAGGSIGSELCRQLHKFEPAALIMLDRDESALHGVQLSLEGRALLDRPELVVADIRDRERLAAVFARHRPDVVFHTAALKHLPLLEMHPDEAVKTNITGTLNVLEAAQRYGTSRFVNVSTDKAADPTSVLGYSKRVTERLTAWAAGRGPMVPISVRFGNVLGSRGSVLTTFLQQLRCGGPVTVTDPEVTRYFMTVGEAVRLVIQAGAIGRPGEVLVLDMGEPVRIVDMVRHLMASVPGRVELVFSGLRPGEKLHEVLLAADERDDRPLHPLISQVPVPPLEPGSPLVRRLSDSGASHEQLIDRLRAAALANRPDAVNGIAGHQIPLSPPVGPPMPAPVGWPTDPATARPFAGRSELLWPPLNGNHVNGKAVGDS